MAAAWDGAVARAGEDPPATLEQAVRDDLANLWSDLDTAMTFSRNGRWSMACDWYTERIVILSRLVGATPWGQIQVQRLLDGTYQGILDAAGVAYDPPDLDEVRRLDWRARP